MKRVNFTEGVELIVGDMNKIVSLQEQNLSDYVLKQLFQNQSDLFFNDSFKVLRNSNTSIDVSAGLGWVYQSQLNSAEPENRFVVLESSAGLSVTPDAALNRIDIVVIEPSIADGDTESRRTKSSDFGAVINENRVVTKVYGATLSIVQGIAAASPVAPAVPAGKLKIAEILVTAVTGIVDQAAITDSRNTVSKLSEDFTHFADGSTIGNPAPGKKRLWIKNTNEIYLRDSSGIDLLLPLAVDASKVTSGVLDAARIPDLDASKITTGTMAGERVVQATTSVRGTVQLNSSINSTSTTLAATASAVKTAYDFAATKAGLYTGSNADESNLPYGSLVIANDGDGTGADKNRNISVAVYLAGDQDYGYNVIGSLGTQLVGTWRRRGRIKNSDGAYLVQRTTL